MSKIEAGLRVVLAFNEAFNRHDVDAMMALVSETCVFESADPAPEGTVYTGKAAVTQYWEDFFRASPHAQINLEEIFGLGERCVTRWRYSWMDTEGETHHVRDVDIFRVRRGLIREKFAYAKV